MLFRSLLTGYMLDALRHADGTPPPDDAAEALLATAASATRTERAAEGLGTDVRLQATGLVGSTLELDGEVIQMTAFARDTDPEGRPTRIARPTRRLW